MSRWAIVLLSISGIVFIYLVYLIGTKKSKIVSTNEAKSDLALQLSDRWLDTVDMVFSKLLSGRFIAVVLDTLVYPGAVILCGYLTHTGKVDAATFIAVLGTYALLVKETRLKYFDRTDRKENDEKITNVTSTVVTTDSGKS